MLGHAGGAPLGRSRHSSTCGLLGLLATGFGTWRRWANEENKRHRPATFLELDGLSQNGLSQNGYGVVKLVGPTDNSNTPYVFTFPLQNPLLIAKIEFLMKKSIFNEKLQFSSTNKQQPAADDHLRFKKHPRTPSEVAVS